MIVALRPFTLRGVPYGPPARETTTAEQLATVTAKRQALLDHWEQRQAVVASFPGAQMPAHEQQNTEQALVEFDSVIERLTATLAAEQVEAKPVVPKAEWDKLPAYKQRNMLSGRFVAQREGRKLQEA